MEQATRGRLTLATQRNDYGRPREQRQVVAKMVLLMLTAASSVGALHGHNTLNAYLCIALLALILPALLIQLCYSNRFWQSLLPHRWWPHIAALGIAYCLPVLMLFTLLAAPLLIPTWAPSTSVEWLAIHLLGLYLNLLTLYVLGVLMHAHQADLGFSVMPLFEEATTIHADPATVEATINAHLAAGKINAAIDVAKNAVRQDTQSIAAQERLYRLLLSAGDRLRSRQQGERLFALCISQGNPRALGLYRSLGTPDEPMLTTAHQALPLARLACREGEHTLALEVLRGFDKRFPGHHDIAAVYLLSAQLLAEKFNQREMAVRILDTLLHRYSRDAIAAEAQRYRDTLNRQA